ncbi:MAG: hypothetical protein ACLFNU_03980 [Bacteroidales bacterium]
MRERVSIFLISIAIIGFQLAIINLLSYSQWHHFAYLAVSIAMLGFGSSGVILSVWRHFFSRYAIAMLPYLFAATGLLMFIVPWLIDLEFVRFDTFLIFTSNEHIFRLLLTCFFLFLPFLTGATVIGLFFMIRSEHIPLFYAWNLAGSAVGGVILVWLSNHVLPMNLAALFGFFGVFSGLLLMNSWRQRALSALVIVFGVVIIIVQPVIPTTSEFKAISKMLLMPNTNVKEREPLVQGAYELVVSENLRQAHGLSLNYSGSVPNVDMGFLNGQPYFTFEGIKVDSTLYSSTIYNLPYIINKKPFEDVLLLSPFGTYLVSQALSKKANVTIVEPIKPLVDSLLKYPWAAPNVSALPVYPREFLLAHDKQWQFIMFPLLGGMGNAGLSAFDEQYLLTTNAIVDALQKLAPDGMLMLSSSMDVPYRNSLKLINTCVAALHSMGLEPTSHLLAIKSWNTLGVIVRPTPFSSEDIENTVQFAKEQGFDMVQPNVGEQTNILPDTTFAVIAKEIIQGKGSGNVDGYAFNISPPNDNSPFFSQFVKLGKLKQYLQEYGRADLPFLELGYFIVWASLLVCLILAILAIALPLFISLKTRKFIFPIWIYFSMLGLAYMLFEVSLIQRSMLTLGNPVTSSAVVISTLLCFSAVGSYYSSGISVKKSLFAVLVSIVVLISLYAFFGGSLSSMVVHKPFIVRLLVIVLSAAPLAILMGMAFPLGMKYLSSNYPEQIPIAWGVNGFFSVLAAPMATIIAVEAGFIQVMLVSAIIYLLSIISAKFFVKN